MKKIKELSYTKLSAWEGDPEAAYLKYGAPTSPDREPQAKPAGMGSGFDARVKSSLHADLFGAHSDPAYEFETLFENQVEPHNRDWCLGESKYVFDAYVALGAYAAILKQVEGAVIAPRFEFEVHTLIDGVPFLAKPDMAYGLQHVHVTHDWKVNGYFGKQSTSPTKGYNWLWPDGKAYKATARNPGGDYEAIDYKGITIAKNCLEDCSLAWADQTTLYDWALGGKPGDDSRLVSMHQLVFKIHANEKPFTRCAAFLSRVRLSYQQFLLGRLHRCWDHLTAGHWFPDVSLEESNARCEILDSQAKACLSDGTLEGDMMLELSRKKYRG